MGFPIVPNTALLRTYDQARQTLDPIAAAEHTASEHDVAVVHVESVLAARESRHNAAEVA